jgi:hypothetical protein
MITRTDPVIMVTVSGIAHAGYWSEIHNSITSEDLFKA